MAGQDDLIKIVLDVVGEEKIEQVRAAIDREKEAIRQLDAALKAGTISQAQFDAASLKSAASIQASSQAIKGISKGLNPQAILEFSRGFEDLQYGIGGVLNNIPGLVTSLGGGAGLAGAISIAAVAATVLSRNWDNLAGVFGGGHVKTAAEEMEELGKKTSLTADEAERLARASAPGEKVKEFQAGKTEAQTNQDSAVTRAVIEAGPRNIVQGILQVAPELVDSQGDAAPAREELDKAKLNLANVKSAPASAEYAQENKDAEERLSAANFKLAKAREDTANLLLSTGALAKLFPGGLSQLQGLVDKDPSAFGPKARQFQGSLKEAAKSPEELAAEEDEDFRVKFNADFDSKLAAFDEEGRIADEKAEQDAQDRSEKFEMDFNTKLVDWQEHNRQKTEDENLAAQLQDMQTAAGKQREDRNRTAQVFDGPAQLRDSIQQTISASNEKDPTAVEILAQTREQTAYLKRIAEQRIDNTPRFQ